MRFGPYRNAVNPGQVLGKKHIGALDSACLKNASPAPLADNERDSRKYQADPLFSMAGTGG